MVCGCVSSGRALGGQSHVADALDERCRDFSSRLAAGRDLLGGLRPGGTVARVGETGTARHIGGGDREVIDPDVVGPGEHFIHERLVAGDLGCGAPGENDQNQQTPDESQQVFRHGRTVGERLPAAGGRPMRRRTFAEWTKHRRNLAGGICSAISRTIPLPTPAPRADSRRPLCRRGFSLRARELGSRTAPTAFPEKRSANPPPPMNFRAGQARRPPCFRAGLAPSFPDAELREISEREAGSLTKMPTAPELHQPPTGCPDVLDQRPC